MAGLNRTPLDLIFTLLPPNMKRLLFLFALFVLSSIIFTAGTENRHLLQAKVSVPASFTSWWTSLFAGQTAAALTPRPLGQVLPDSDSPLPGSTSRQPQTLASQQANPHSHPPTKKERPSNTGSSKIASETSRNIEISFDQETGARYQTPAQAAAHLAEAEVLNEADGPNNPAFDESALLPSRDEPESRTLRWLEAILVDGVDEREVAELARLLKLNPPALVRQEIISAASLGESSADLRHILKTGLNSAQPLAVRIQALHVAQDHFPDLVTAMTQDLDEDLRLQAESLQDPGRQGSDYRE
jgi:hypothetical protein